MSRLIATKLDCGMLCRCLVLLGLCACSQTGGANAGPGDYRARHVAGRSTAQPAGPVLSLPRAPFGRYGPDGRDGDGGDGGGEGGGPRYLTGATASRNAALAFAVARPWRVQPCAPVSGVLLPHHFVAAPLSAAALAGVSRAVKTVVLLVPDHQQLSSAPVSISLARWRSSGRIIKPARKLAEQLVAERLVAVDEFGFAHEHAVTEVLPLVAQAFGAVEFLPLRFRPLPCGQYAEQAERIGAALARYLGSDGLVVVSVDFVHDRSSAYAAAADRRSAAVLRRLQPAQACSVQADSPLALVAWLAYGRASGANRFVPLKQSDSHQLGASSADSVVSYLTGYLSRGGRQPVSLLAVGDVMLGRHIHAAMRARGDYVFPFNKVVAALRAADLTVANLESQFVAGCPVRRSGYRFCADPRAIDGLVRTGVDVVGVANNHRYDFGRRGLRESVRRLRAAGLAVAGYDGPVTLRRHGQRFTLFGYDAVNGPFKPVDMERQLLARPARAQPATANTGTAALVVLMHWGREEHSQPNDLQKRLAAQAIGAGAELILGSHPHVLQPLVRHISSGGSSAGSSAGSSWVAYSLGNFVFDQMQDEATRKGGVLNCTFCGARPVACKQIPVELSPPGVPATVGLDQP